MLQHLNISNYALIRELSIDFAPGYSVITGETGAGKSIILGALGLLRGDRADSRVVQDGARKCVVEAEFSLDGDGLRDVFRKHDIDYEEGSCIVRREVSAAGKSRAFVNDTPATLSALREIAAALFDIHSQHRNLLLGEENFLLETLDALAPDAQLPAHYRASYLAWKHADDALQALRAQARMGKEEEEYLRFQLSQLDDARLQAGEQEELEALQETLEHAEEIKQALLTANRLVAGDDELSPLENMRTATGQLHSISRVFPQAEELASRLESARIELDDIAGEAETLAERIEFDPQRLAETQERLSTIYSLQKRHAASDIDQLLSIADDLRERLGRTENIDADIAAQEKETAKLLRERDELASRLTQNRLRAAEALQKGLTAGIASLGMPHGTVVFSLAAREKPDATGGDTVSLLFSANKNVKPVDVSDVASGGEVSRLMLSLKSILAQHRSLPTIIFDEIDTGVSGTMAEKMAQAMRGMSKGTQVICITHLPQIAAMGNAHYRVYKEEDGATVSSHIARLTEEERIAEIANMLSGEKMTQAAIDNAKSLLGNKAS
ncbi:MAG: DNA repair protein RecN [Alloprevotella sp.]|nr:DNA repair protein RecN [Alloprevotella sp.]